MSSSHLLSVLLSKSLTWQMNYHSLAKENIILEFLIRGKQNYKKEKRPTEESGNRKQWEKYIERFLMRRKLGTTCEKHTNGNAAKHRITATFSFKSTHKNNYLPSTLDKVWMRAAFSLSESILVMISIWNKTSKRNSRPVIKCSFSLYTYLFLSPLYRKPKID